jgi:hypothetical protein
MGVEFFYLNSRIRLWEGGGGEQQLQYNCADVNCSSGKSVAALFFST